MASFFFTLCSLQFSLFSKNEFEVCCSRRFYYLIKQILFLTQNKSQMKSCLFHQSPCVAIFKNVVVTGSDHAVCCCRLILCSCEFWEESDEEDLISFARQNRACFNNKIHLSVPDPTGDLDCSIVMQNSYLGCIVTNVRVTLTTVTMISYYRQLCDILQFFLFVC